MFNMGGGGGGGAEGQKTNIFTHTQKNVQFKELLSVAKFVIVLHQIALTVQSAPEFWMALCMQWKMS